MIKIKQVVFCGLFLLIFGHALYPQALSATGIKVQSFDSTQRALSDTSSLGLEFESLGNETGIYSRKETDITIPGREGGVHLSLNRTYNSRYFSTTTNVFMVPKNKVSYTITDLFKIPMFSFGKNLEGMGGGWDTNIGGTLQIVSNHIYERKNVSYYVVPDYSEDNNMREYSQAIIEVQSGTYIFRKCKADGQLSWTNNIKGDYSTFTEISISSQPDPQLGFSIPTTVGYLLTLTDGTKYEFKNNVYNWSYKDYFQTFNRNEHYDLWGDTNSLLFYLTSATGSNGDTLRIKYESPYTAPMSQSSSTTTYPDIFKHEETTSEVIWPTRIASITDSFGRALHFLYRESIPVYSSIRQIDMNAAQKSTQISKVRYTGVNGDLQEIQYGYDAQNLLSNVTYPSGKQVIYSYSYYNQGKSSEYKDKGYLLSSIIDSTGLDTEIGYTWKDASVQSARNSSYVLDNLLIQGAGLPNGVRYNFSYSDSASYTPYFIVQDKWSSRWWLHGSTFITNEIDNSFCFQNVSITSPLGSRNNVYSQGLLTSSTDPLGWITSQTWNYDKRQLLRTTLTKKGTSKYTAYNQYDNYGNPKIIEEGGTGVLTTSRQYSYVWESSSNSNWRDYATRNGLFNLVLSESKMTPVSGHYLSTTYEYTSLFNGNGTPSILGPTSKITRLSSYIFLYPIIPVPTLAPLNILETYDYYPSNSTTRSATFVKSKILPLSKRIDYTYSNGLYPAATTYSDIGLTTSLGYNLNTGLLVNQVGFNQTKNSTYYADGRLKEVIYNPGQSDESRDTYTYDIPNRKTTLVDRVNNKTITTVDGLGRTIKTENFSPNVSTAYQEEIFTYTAGGKVETDTIVKRDPTTGSTSTRVTRYTYDAGNRLTSMTLPDNSVTRITYTDDQELRTQTDAKGNITKYFFDGYDRVIKIIDANNNPTLYTYDSLGNLSQVTDASGKITSYFCDSLGRLQQMKSPYAVCTYTYDDNSNLTEVVKGQYPLHPRRFSTQYQNYDSLGFYSTRVSGTYEGASTTLQNTLTEQFFYHDASRLAKGLLWKTQGNGYTVDYTYNKDGLITAMNHTFPNATQTALGFQYNAIGQHLSTTTPWGTIAYTYDPQQRLDTVKFNTALIAQYQYDATKFGNPTQIALNNGAITVQSSYFNAPYTDWISNQAVKLGTTSVATLGYQYDAIGNRTSLSSSISGQPAQTVQYTYDSLSQLTQAVYPGMTFAYQYDAIGNRTSMQTPYGTGSYPAAVVGTTTRALGLNYNGTTTSQLYNAMTGALQSNTYKLGQTVARNQAYTFDPLDRLTAVADFQAGVTTNYTFQYDTRSNRIAQSKNNQVQTYYVWGQTQTPIAELNASGTLIKLTLQTPNGEKLADSFGNPTSTGYWRFYANDPLGTPIVSFTNASKIESQYSLTPFGDFRFKDSFTLSQLDPVNAMALQLSSSLLSGQSLALQSKQIRLVPGFWAKSGSSLKLTSTTAPTAATSDAKTPVSFTGKTFEPGIGLYYFNARWYDPVMGRFISVDPKTNRDLEAPLRFNPYLYCVNNPLTYVDPDGKNPVVIAGIGGIVSFGLDYYHQYKQSGMNFKDYYWSGSYSPARAAGEMALGAVSTTIGGAVGGLNTGFMTKSLLFMGNGIANTYLNNKLTGENINLAIGGLAGLGGSYFGQAIESGIGKVLTQVGISKYTTSYLGDNIKYGIRGYSFEISNSFSAGTILGNAGGDFFGSFSISFGSPFGSSQPLPSVH